MKALVLFSGGLDSTTCLSMAIEKYGSDNVITLSMYYGQKHNKELKAVEDIVNLYKVKHISLDFKKIFEGSNCSLLESSTNDIPLDTYENQLKNSDTEIVSTYVPYRNGLFLSAAASVAISNGCNEIYYGIHADDRATSVYPDTSVEFNKAIADAIKIGSGHQVEVVAPFVNLSKAAIVKEGLRLKTPYNLTWSCYNGNDKACGKCATCLDRLKAFKENNTIDPIEYEDKENE